MFKGVFTLFELSLIKEFIKRALILNLNLHHALKKITYITY